ncbi:MAG TPA: lanthionine synthetase LanC family protein [Gemmatimonadales bacterium]
MNVEFEPDAALRVAESIGDHLCRTAYRHGDRCTWMGIAQDTDEDEETIELTYRTLGPELYDGTSGVGLFLAELHRKTGEPRYRSAALGAIAQAVARRETGPRQARFSSFSGVVGIAYAAARIGRLLDAPDLVAQAGAALLPPTLDLDEEFWLDVVAGAAGGIPVLLVLADWLDRPDLTRCARALGERLVAEASKSAEAWSWTSTRSGLDTARDLTGFAHGAAGIGWALLELGHAFHEPALVEGALEGFRYENQWFRPEHDNWPDFRTDDGQEEPAPCSVAWCHGAPGIGLSRLRAFELAGGAEQRSDAEAAVRTAKRTLQDRDEAEGMGFSLCHGRAGIADFLLLAGSRLGDPEAYAVALETAAAGALRYGDHPALWPCGFLRGSTPALMVGLAGIGYFYLRIADPAVPSVLLLGSAGATEAGERPRLSSAATT